MYRNPNTSAARRWARENDTVRKPRHARPTARRTNTRQAAIAAAMKEA